MSESIGDVGDFAVLQADDVLDEREVESAEELAEHQQGSRQPLEPSKWTSPQGVRFTPHEAGLGFNLDRRSRSRRLWMTPFSKGTAAEVGSGPRTSKECI
jgi:hypothetical protein